MAQKQEEADLKYKYDSVIDELIANGATTQMLSKKIDYIMNTCKSQLAPKEIARKVMESS